eukprot:m.117115 g.117115  ORF g.117115 m.117115 type:complete len:733 (+) comp15535_c0_seq1:112-2310(+)
MSLWKFNIMASIQQVAEVIRRLVGPKELFEQLNQVDPAVDVPTSNDQSTQPSTALPAVYTQAEDHSHPSGTSGIQTSAVTSAPPDSLQCQQQHSNRADTAIAKRHLQHQPLNALKAATPAASSDKGSLVLDVQSLARRESLLEPLDTSSRASVDPLGGTPVFTHSSDESLDPVDESSITHHSTSPPSLRASSSQTFVSLAQQAGSDFSKQLQSFGKPDRSADTEPQPRALDKPVATTPVLPSANTVGTPPQPSPHSKLQLRFEAQTEDHQLTLLQPPTHSVQRAKVSREFPTEGRIEQGESAWRESAALVPNSGNADLVGLVDDLPTDLPVTEEIQQTDGGDQSTMSSKLTRKGKRKASPTANGSLPTVNTTSRPSSAKPRAKRSKSAASRAAPRDALVDEVRVLLNQAKVTTQHVQGMLGYSKSMDQINDNLRAMVQSDRATIKALERLLGVSPGFGHRLASRQHSREWDLTDRSETSSLVDPEETRPASAVTTASATERRPSSRLRRSEGVVKQSRSHSIRERHHRGRTHHKPRANLTSIDLQEFACKRHVTLITPTVAKRPSQPLSSKTRTDPKASTGVAVPVFRLTSVTTSKLPKRTEDLSDERFQRRHGPLELAERKMKLRDAAALEARLQLLRNVCQRSSGRPDEGDNDDNDDDDDMDDEEDISPWTCGLLTPRLPTARFQRDQAQQYQLDCDDQVPKTGFGRPVPLPKPKSFSLPKHLLAKDRLK